MLVKEKGFLEVTTIEKLINNEELYEIRKYYSNYQIEKCLELKYPVLQLVFDFNIPIELMTEIDKVIRKDRFIQQRINELNTGRNIYKLYYGLKNRFGRVPKTISYMLEMIDEFNIELLIEKFNFKGMKYALSLDKEIPSIYTRISYGLMFHNRVYDVIEKLIKYNRNLTSFVSGIPSKYPLTDSKLEEWVISNAGRTKNEVIHEVVTFWNEPDFPKSSNLEEKRDYFNNNRIELEWQRCQKKYPEVFTGQFECKLDYTSIQIGEEKVYVLEPNDQKQVYLGQLSVCCQRLDGSAEASMMEGLLNPMSGFLVFERGNKLLAQSWIWLAGDNKTLVLDNIEFADNRKPSHIIHLLKEWLLASPYLDIQMGIGFNNLIIGETVNENDICWYKPHWKHRYTDANERVWLKKDNKLLI